MKNIEHEAGCSADTIRHSGIVKKVDNDFYYVSIVAQSACASCHVKGACNVTDMNEEVVEVPRHQNMNYNVGDNVQVAMKKSLGTRAVMLGYLIPFGLVLVTLLVTLGFVDDQGLAGLAALGILIPYYLILYRIKDRLKRTFVFSIQ